VADLAKDQTGRDATGGWSRRNFLRGAAVAAVAADGLLTRNAPAAEENATPELGSAPVSGDVKITLNVNGKPRQVTVEPRTTLVSALRDRLDPAVTGPKLVCDAATCGACSVILDGKIVYGCSVLAVDAVGKKVETVEGFGTPDNMSPVQAAFVEKDAMMCGFCTSGFVTSGTALLRQNPNPTHEQVREGCKGNFCRCGTYPHVFDAILTAAKNGGAK
jgi:xanthine dehydrogenase YagT iron-sulfur-binding subunit